MGLFGRKKEKEQDNKRYNQKALMTSFDLMEYFIVKDRSNEELFKLCDTILSGKPVLANFDKIAASDCNYILAFMSGVVYATDGQVVRISERVYLFARKQEFEDGSLNEYIEDNRQWFIFTVDFIIWCMVS